MHASLIYLTSIFWMLAPCLLSIKTVLYNAYSLNTSSDKHQSCKNNKIKKSTTTTATQKEDAFVKYSAALAKVVGHFLTTNPTKYFKFFSKNLLLLFNSGWLAKNTTVWETRAVFVHRYLCTECFVQHLPPYLNICMPKHLLECSQHRFPCQHCSEVLSI